MDETTRRKFNERVLAKHDPNAHSILVMASFVVLYKHEADQWVRLAAGASCARAFSPLCSAGSPAPPPSDLLFCL